MYCMYVQAAVVPSMPPAAAVATLSFNLRRHNIITYLPASARSLAEEPF